MKNAISLARAMICTGLNLTLVFFMLANVAVMSYVAEIDDKERK